MRTRECKSDVDEDLKKTCYGYKIKVNQCMDKLRVADAITEIFNLFKRCNKYIDETMPWVLAKEEGKQDRLATVLYNLVESITIGASLLSHLCLRHQRRYLSSLIPRRERLQSSEPSDFILQEKGY